MRGALWSIREVLVRCTVAARWQASCTLVSCIAVRLSCLPSCRTPLRPACRKADMLISKLPNVGTTIFTTISQLAADAGALILSQGFPAFVGPAALRQALAPQVSTGTTPHQPAISTAREKTDQ